MTPGREGNSGHSGPRKIAWFSYFPVEWLPEPPEPLRKISKQHPATWQRVLWEELRHREDIELHIFSLRKDYSHSFQFQRDNTTFHCVKTPGGLRAPSLYWTDTLLLRRELRRVKPDLCHAWGTEFGAAMVASRLGYPTVVTMQGILTWLKKIFPLSRQTRISAFLEPTSLRRARVVTAESSFAIRFLRERHPHLKLLQVEHAPNPIFFGVKRRPQTAPMRFLAIGHFVHDKGPDILLPALQQLSSEMNFQLVWVGSAHPEYVEQVRASVSPELWKRVQLRQNLTPEEVAEEVSRAMLLVYPTRADNSPNAVKEAAVAGLPVVASRVGGIPDYVTEELNGFLFTAGDVTACRDAIRKAMMHPLFREGRVDAATLQTVRGYLSPATMADKFMHAYEVVQEAYGSGRQGR